MALTTKPDEPKPVAPSGPPMTLGPAPVATPQATAAPQNGSVFDVALAAPIAIADEARSTVSARRSPYELLKTTYVVGAPEPDPLLAPLVAPSAVTDARPDPAPPPQANLTGAPALTPPPAPNAPTTQGFVQDTAYVLGAPFAAASNPSPNYPSPQQPVLANNAIGAPPPMPVPPPAPTALPNPGTQPIAVQQSRAGVAATVKPDGPIATIAQPQSGFGKDGPPSDPNGPKGAGPDHENDFKGGGVAAAAASAKSIKAGNKMAAARLQFETLPTGDGVEYKMTYHHKDGTKEELSHTHEHGPGTSINANAQEPSAEKIAASSQLSPSPRPDSSARGSLRMAGLSAEPAPEPKPGKNGPEPSVIATGSPSARAPTGRVEVHKQFAGLPSSPTPFPMSS